ncbi:MAG: amino acid ABC transporter permease [Phreatobacter sp.]|uniref:amino acid ABC transporter permease n=1 Tax=Phreatobacter sp. TaxID=1966341 RepID=UPI001A432090|nr:amino acid ABC transporter permease [Phreatobacter sp.]MBL8570709.1 amino acid ABC transporter permease [Phreatobacter sp.]
MTAPVPAPMTAPNVARPTLRSQLFGTRTNTLITLVLFAVAAFLLGSVIRWAFIDSLWKETREGQCATVSGACWAVIQARYRLILFGLYPYDEHWRSALACLVALSMVLLSCMPRFWSLRRLVAIWLCGAGIFVLLMRGGVLGLPLVTTDKWGGLALTLYVYLSTVIIGVPLGIVLALGRQSDLPAIRFVITMVVDFVRSIPILAVVFCAALFAPFILPGWLTPDTLYRVILAFAFFFSCYYAMIVTGGIQTVTPGQYDAAAALGLGYWRCRLLIVMPQALRAALPATINHMVITLKETSVLIIIGMFELTASGNAALQSSQWQQYYIEVYIFVSLIYFTLSFSLSRYGAYLERKMRVGSNAR